MRKFADRVGGDAGLTLGVREGVRLDLLAIGLEVEGRALDELGVGQSRVDDLPPDGVRQRDVAADIESQPRVRPFGGARPSWVNREQACSIADAAQEVMEEDRMRLSGIAAPENDQIGLLDLTI